jgi:uncharacterized protein (TIGR02453 family)
MTISEASARRSAESASRPGPRRRSRAAGPATPPSPPAQGASHRLTPGLFDFFRELARHNDRQWFEANRDRFLRDVRDPLLAFVAGFAPRLGRISAHMVADPRPVGGSVFRIHRDIRFSRDKTPYKTHAGLSFRHRQHRDVHGPIFYLHLQPGMVFAAAGIWKPPPETLEQIRQAIVAHPASWRRATRTCPLGDHAGGRLKRTPRGYDPAHPLAADLARLSFTTHTGFTERQACAPDFLDRFARACRDAAPLMQFLSSAVGLGW